jgi:hypothetical protein
MNRIKIVLISLIFSSLSIHAQDVSETKLLNKFHSITSEEMMSWVVKLCSPEFNGRLTGTPEFVASAEWITGKLKEWDLKPGGDNGDYYQWFDFPYTVVNDIGSLSLKIPQADGTVITKNYNYPDEYYPGMNSGSGEVTAEVVFAG